MNSDERKTFFEWVKNPKPNAIKEFEDRVKKDIEIKIKEESDLLKKKIEETRRREEEKKKKDNDDLAFLAAIV